MLGFNEHIQNVGRLKKKYFKSAILINEQCSL